MENIENFKTFISENLKQITQARFTATTACHHAKLDGAESAFYEMWLETHRNYDEFRYDVKSIAAYAGLTEIVRKDDEVINNESN